MSMTTNLYEQINEALKPVYLSQDEFEEQVQITHDNLGVW